MQLEFGFKYASGGNLSTFFGITKNLEISNTREPYGRKMESLEKQQKMNDGLYKLARFYSDEHTNVEYLRTIAHNLQMLLSIILNYMEIISRNFFFSAANSTLTSLARGKLTWVLKIPCTTRNKRIPERAKRTMNEFIFTWKINFDWRKKDELSAKI